MSGEDKQSATQRTAKGLEIPVPKRKDVLDAFRKIIRPKQDLTTSAAIRPASIRPTWRS
jgi:hypothetical protein